MSVKNFLLLFTAALIWGTAFVAQKSGMDLVSPVAFNGIRTLVGAFALIPVILIMDSLAKRKNPVDDRTPEQKKKDRNLCIIGGIACGTCLFVASTLQQYGIFFTTAGKSGFITSLYAVLVPIISIVIGKKVRKIIWLCVAGGAVGLYLLCIPPGEGFTIQRGDFFVLLCAFAFALHIMVIDHFSPKTNGVKLSCIQFLFAGAVGIVLMFIFEEPTMSAILASWVPILYAGIMSCGIAYTLQVVAQADAEPTEASLIPCLESVFSVITGALILGESMPLRGYLGCALIFGAVVLSQLPSKEDRLKAHE